MQSVRTRRRNTKTFMEVYFLGGLSVFVKLSFFLSFLLNKLLENVPNIPQTFLRLRISWIMLTCLLACYIVSLTPEAKC